MRSTLRTAEKLWAFKANSEIKSSPVVVGDRVLIGSYDQHLYCLSARNGSVLMEGANRRAGARDAEHFRRRRFHRRM